SCLKGFKEFLRSPSGASSSMSRRG
uniref:Uncharacterized protein n=1 Tax=Amphimedon queenslandica TaxID=400682 RepID=A0A1X7T4S3_AMPQE